MVEFNKRIVTMSWLSGIALVAATVLYVQGFASSETNAGIVYAAPAICKLPDQAKAMVNFTYSSPPAQLGKRTLQCTVPQEDMVVFIYGERPLSRNPLDSMQSDDSIIVRASNVTKGGSGQIDIRKAYEALQADVVADRPDLQPRLLTINGHPGWGTEGGEDLMIVEVQDENGNVEERHTYPAPSTLLVTVNGISYSFNGYVQLSELVGMASTFAE